MRFHASPPFKTSHWSRLWHNNIPDLETLQWRASQSGLVVISIGKNASKSGPGVFFDLCFINILDKKYQKPSNDFERFKQQYNVRSHVLRTTRCHPISSNILDINDIGVTYHFPYLVDDALRHLIRSFRSQLPTYETPLILAVYDPNREFEILSRQCPTFMKSFESWVDLGELSREISPGQEKMRLASTLRSFGFTLRQGANSAFDAHWPPLTPKAEESESLRIAAALVNMLWHPRGSQVGKIPLWDLEALKRTIAPPHEHMTSSNAEKLDSVTVRESLSRNSFYQIQRQLPHENMPSRISVPLNRLPLMCTIKLERQIIRTWAAAVAESEPDEIEGQFADYSLYSDEDVDFNIDIYQLSLNDYTPNNSVPEYNKT